MDNNNTYWAVHLQESGSLFYSFDALFGLCRKKAAGMSVRPPLHKGVMFESQEEVKAFINGYQVKSKSQTHVHYMCSLTLYVDSQYFLFLKQECNEFLAGNALRAKSRYHALDETAVIGMSCRHEFPQKFMSIHYGER